MFEYIQELGKIEVEYKFNPYMEDKITFKSYIKSVEQDYILIDFLYNKGVEYNIPPEKQIKVNFKENSGIYSGTSYILGRDNSNLSGLMISYPTNVEFIQQREFVRIPMKLKVDLYTKTSPDGTNTKHYQVETTDISGSGISFVSDAPIERHQGINGLIHLKSTEKPIEVKLKHVYSRSFITSSKERYKNAFTFVDIDEKIRDKIVKEIFLFQLEMKRKGI